MGLPASGIQQGYKFALRGMQDGYVINADPIAYGSDASRAFYSDPTAVIRENCGSKPATAEDRAVGLPGSELR